MVYPFALLFNPSLDSGYFVQSLERTYIYKNNGDKRYVTARNLFDNVTDPENLQNHCGRISISGI